MNAVAERLVIKRSFNAPVERVYAAWTDAEQMKRWFAPGQMSVPGAEADVRVGGRYRVQMADPKGEGDCELHTTGGVYREVVPNQRLVFTWQWEGSALETVVTLQFRSVSANETELTLIHEGFDSQDTRDKHAQGWQGCLANLHAFLQ
jgi:uncharacterized protein YndB with AHSA1/START domain